MATFLAQAVIVTACFVVALSQSLPSATDSPSQPKKKRQVDVLGLLTFGITMASFLVLVDRGSKDQPLPVVVTLAVMTAAFATAFLLIESYWATAPLIPLSLLKQGGAGFYFAVQILLLVAHFGMLTNLAPYFTHTENATNTVAALHFLPAPFGNAIGALVGGRLINKSKRYKLLSIVAVLLLVASFIAMLLRWHGRISIWESLYIFPAGFAVGLLASTQFVGVSSAVGKEQVATILSMFFLSGQIGIMIGASGSSALLHRVFRDTLVRKLAGKTDGKQVSVSN
ncbi:MAG: hypothetical protein Q9222_002474 [Ikaeria aurantiellina]